MLGTVFNLYEIKSTELKNANIENTTVGDSADKWKDLFHIYG